MDRKPPPRPRRGRTVSAGDTLAELIRGLPGSGARDLAWRRACGPRLAGRTRVLGLEDAVLRIAVPDDAWALHLGRMARTLLGRVRAVLREDVRRLAFEVRPDAVPSPPAAAPRARVEPGPEVRDLVRQAGVKRPALAEAVARAAAAHTAAPDEGEDESGAE